jgi:hypothetical protein
MHAEAVAKRRRRIDCGVTLLSRRLRDEEVVIDRGHALLARLVLQLGGKRGGDEKEQGEFAHSEEIAQKEGEICQAQRAYRESGPAGSSSPAGTKPAYVTPTWATSQAAGASRFEPAGGPAQPAPSGGVPAATLLAEQR